MKLLRQVALILLISFVGEILKTVIPLPIPASVYGLVLMLIAFFFIEIMPVMFIPAAVGLIDSWASLQPVFWPVAIITIITTILVMVVTGRITQSVIRRERRKKHE